MRLPASSAMKCMPCASLQVLYLELETKTAKSDAAKLHQQLEEALVKADATERKLTAAESQHALQLEQLVAELNAAKCEWTSMSELADEIKAGEIDAAVQAAVKAAREEEVEKQSELVAQVGSPVLIMQHHAKCNVEQSFQA